MRIKAESLINQANKKPKLPTHKETNKQKHKQTKFKKSNPKKESNAFRTFLG
jgi:hypothetical protein